MQLYTTDSTTPNLNSARDLYLGLLKDVLSYSLWPEPPVPAVETNFARSLPRRAIINAVSRVAELLKCQLVKESLVTPEDKHSGRIWPKHADTMIGMYRLNNIQHCVEMVIKENISGDLIETGVWRGGACIFMRAILAAFGDGNRRVFVADSFEGLPRPDAARYPADGGDKHFTHDELRVSLDAVKDNFRKYNLLDEQVVFLKGWFKDSLPTAPVEHLSVLRLDGDMYGSTMDALQYLYPKLSSGGFCIIDDFGLQGCKSAVGDYRAAHYISEPLVSIDHASVFWRKA